MYECINVFSKLVTNKNSYLPWWPSGFRSIPSVLIFIIDVLDIWSDRDPAAAVAHVVMMCTMILFLPSIGLGITSLSLVSESLGRGPSNGHGIP